MTTNGSNSSSRILTAYSKKKITFMTVLQYIAQDAFDECKRTGM